MDMQMPVMEGLTATRASRTAERARLATLIIMPSSLSRGDKPWLSP